MSEPVRVALVVEGPTDKIVIQAAICEVLGERSYVLKQLHPEEALAFGNLGTGWVGVFHWCRQAVMRAGGSIRNDPLFVSYDILVLHLDADVADKSYSDGSIVENIDDLPCAEPCPPPSATTNRLRQVLRRWTGENATPPRTVLCTPSKSTEAWVLAAIFPTDKAVREGNLECWPNPEARLGQQPKGKRITKTVRDYQSRAAHFQRSWPAVSNKWSEAKRFTEEFSAIVPVLT